MAEIVFRGQSFKALAKTPPFALMRFAKAQKATAKDQGEQMMNVMAATYDLLEACILPEDWPRFERLAISSGADEEELMDVVVGRVEEEAGHPTQRSSDSSDGPSTASTSLPADSSSAVMLREGQGRPDLAQVHHLAEHSRASA